MYRQMFTVSYTRYEQMGNVRASREYFQVRGKKKCKTIVRKVLPRAAANRDQAFPDYGRHTRSQSKGGDLREEAPAEERAVKNLELTVRHLGCTEKLYGFSGTLLCCQYKRKEPQPSSANFSRKRRRIAPKHSHPSHSVPRINIRWYTC